MVIPGISSRTDEPPLSSLIRGLERNQIVRFDCWGGSTELEKVTLEELHELIEEGNKLLKDIDFQNKIVIGKSFGGQLALTYQQDLELDLMILLAPAVGTNENNIDRWKSTQLKKASEPTDISIQRKDLSSLQTKTLIFHGTEDEVIPMRNSQKIADSLPNGELITFEGADHSFKGYERELLESIRSKFNDIRGRKKD